MDWRNFLTKIDWLTVSIGCLDNIFEYLMKMNVRDRLIFFEQFEYLDEHQRPKSGDEILSEVYKWWKGKR